MSFVTILTIIIFSLSLIYSISTYYSSATFVNGKTPLPSTYKDKLNDNFNGILIFYDEMTNIKFMNLLSNKKKKINSSILINVLDEREPLQTKELIKVYQVKSTPTAFIIENGVVKKSINANEKLLSVKELEDFIQR